MDAWLLSWQDIDNYFWNATLNINLLNPKAKLKRKFHSLKTDNNKKNSSIEWVQTGQTEQSIGMGTGAAREQIGSKLGNQVTNLHTLHLFAGSYILRILRMQIIDRHNNKNNIS